MKNKISIKGISELAGVSIATVSRIINENGRYSKETEERVKKIIEEYDYIPDMVAKGLRTKKMTNIGIIVPEITNEFFVKLAYEIEINLFRSGYSSFICNTNEDVEMEQKRLQMMRMQNVSGLIYISGGSSGVTEYIQDIPTVFIDRTPPVINDTDNQFIIIESDNVQGGYLATRELLDKGCRKIIMLTDYRRLSSQKARIEGYEKAHRESGIAVNPDYVINLDKMNFETAFAAVSKLLEEGVPFDGIFATTDWLALGSYAALNKKGIKIPREVKIVGYDDISVSEFNALPITTIHQQIDVIGKTAVDYMLQLLKDNPIEEKKLCVPVYLVKRQST
ncbi:LacI family transcriptional regulator [Anaerotaenia torta]|uniref:LacI family DNA-binding transcriptional regulator n=1 Tax=Anaerotaenia torta TaxID=433293 RepID=UPI003D229590